MNWHLFSLAEVLRITEALVAKLVQAKTTVHQDTWQALILKNNYY